MASANVEMLKRIGVTRDDIMGDGPPGDILSPLELLYDFFGILKDSLLGDWLVPEGTGPEDLRRFRKEVTVVWAMRCLLFTLLCVILSTVVRSLILRGTKSYRSPQISRIIDRILILVWIAGTLVTTLIQIHGDATFLVKRLGRVCVSLMPPLYLLTLRPTPLPFTIYLQLIPLHKWISRLTVLYALIHGVLYTCIYFQTNKLFKLLLFRNISGIIALLIFLLMAVSSLRPFRNHTWKIFYAIHYPGAWLAVIFTFLHAVPPANGYMLTCISILVVQVVYRLLTTRHLRLPTQYASSTLYLVSIPKHKVPDNIGDYYPASHVRISYPIWNPLYWLYGSHPYSIASLSDDDNFQLVIRKTRFPINFRSIYSISSPFMGIPSEFTAAISKNQVKKLLLVAGGSGIAYAVPLMRYAKRHGASVKLLWAVRDFHDVNVLDAIVPLSEISEEEIEVYATGSRLPHFSEIHYFSRRHHNHHLHNDDSELDVSVDDDCCGKLNDTLSKPSRRKPEPSVRRKSSIYGSFDQDHAYEPNLFHHRPVLNMRIKSWLCGIKPDSNDCCCMDQLMDVSLEDKAGLWVSATGGERLVNEVEGWAARNDFSFIKERFS